MKKNKLNQLQQALGYTFEQLSLLDKALSHRSISGENNERLEFLGDSILNFCISDFLFAHFPAASEGELSCLRASLVKGETLAALAIEFDLGDYLNLGSGELKSGGFRRPSILADAVEAIIGAIYLDSDLETVKARVFAWFESRINSLSLNASPKDPKTQLQEWLQARRLTLPEYSLQEVRGQAHCQTFKVMCKVEKFSQVTFGEASNRRAAEKQAAQNMLCYLAQNSMTLADNKK